MTVKVDVMPFGYICVLLTWIHTPVDYVYFLILQVYTLIAVANIAYAIGQVNHISLAGERIQ
jgi:hypothetical protein